MQKMWTTTHYNVYKERLTRDAENHKNTRTNTTKQTTIRFKNKKDGWITDE